MRQADRLRAVPCFLVASAIVCLASVGSSSLADDEHPISLHSIDVRTGSASAEPSSALVHPTGRIERGIVSVGDEVEIIGLRPTAKTVVTGVEMFRKGLNQGEAGDNIGALLRDTAREDPERGQVLAKPGSITPHMKFKAEAYILTKDEGGRHIPFFSNYRSQF